MLDLSGLNGESLITWGEEFRSHNDSGMYFFDEKNIDCQVGIIAPSESAMFMLKIISISGEQECGSFVRFHLGTQVSGPSATPKLCTDKNDGQLLILPSDKILIRLKTDDTPLIDAQFQLTAYELSGADHKCHEGLFSCDSGKCIHEDFLCDGKNQCPGEETDELAENCPVKIAPPVAMNNKSKAGGLILALLLSIRNQGRRNTIWRFMKLLVINHKTAQIH
ncbi:Oidioi.mRNA.OKI2018_I69.PAR.g10871.t1.cds [Oikopleura dioica]|uniref:Oidioi.mRNA.OKI2018_I69.PAR.g10871.t1.cds n=1 Tax=Oikopleura dioica TaxID=34765 RepID=A0ABN7RT44_OIKDI|nr:Oidioi.mRNA.OKI2018_I69.PAR.g10871.t1.cds [Oikopleura dioica]